MKRLFDLVFSVIGLIVCLPLFVLIAFLIKCNSRGPVFFIQKRVGKGFRLFKLYKFRTMITDASQKGLQVTAVGDPRITKVGRFLRKTKIDELPQLINVFKGDMSLVGPRPEVPKYVEIFRDDYQDILKIKPGITDYATIEFRDEEGVLEKFEDPEDGYIREVLPIKIKLYKKYLEDSGFFTDVKLIVLTLTKIVRG
ncbi:sugar transferase [Candidatus Brocadia sapporoensis]|uniref:Sugar transferase n=1 Tax=Candidatus Brocadia sapporoensis TaxID=392547 RepID=A0A1V6LXN8_9BACT|nr:sugar transferase [Candidatus Brocadia sapporoensis]MDG6006649.1 sugar transferase [Candidatus Brocadia sp.]OQD44908.1 sugar transferase [Candidatus Brocadia sapporoensis]